MDQFHLRKHECPCFDKKPEITNSCEEPGYSAVKLELNPKYFYYVPANNDFSFFSCSVTGQRSFRFNHSLEMLINRNQVVLCQKTTLLENLVAEVLKC